jgi:peptidoglycan/LPS O-acetylase OafA/YrhL
MSEAMSYDAFRERRYIPVLDGMRALAILGVVTHHAREHVFGRLHGCRGVCVFFVLSGFLITTLSLREEAAVGRLDVRAFMLRRVFRIMPLYYLTLVAVILWACVFRVIDGGDALISHLASYVFYCSEFPIISTGFTLPFGQSWSLGIEEKFYLVWPFLAFWVFARSKHRPKLTLVLILSASALALSTGVLAQIWTSYVAILLGCLLGLLLHDPASFRKLSVLGRTRPAWSLLSILALATLAPRVGGRAGDCVYAPSPDLLRVT